MRAGVTFRDPATPISRRTSRSAPTPRSARTSQIRRPHARSAAAVRIDGTALLRDVDDRRRCPPPARVVMTECRVGAGAVIGPFAHLRPGTDLATGGPHRQLRRDQEGPPRRRHQGEPPHLPRRRRHRRADQRRRRHDHLQLRRLREARDGDRQPRADRQRHAARGAGDGRRRRLRRRRHDGDARRAGGRTWSQPGRRSVRCRAG